MGARTEKTRRNDPRYLAVIAKNREAVLDALAS
jgi:hypothetical protein